VMATDPSGLKQSSWGCATGSEPPPTIGGRKPKVFIWPSTGTHWGHASIMLSDGTYISYMPRRPMRPKAPFDEEFIRTPDYTYDKKVEGGREPEVYRPSGLDQEAMKRWWGNGGATHGKWTSFNNCSDIVIRALNAGGANLREGSMYTLPEDVARQLRWRDRVKNNPLPPPICNPN
jgi:hypothetical protein